MLSQADRNLLLGILALRLDLIDPLQLSAALSNWTRDTSQALDEILVRQDALRQETRGALIELVDKHLQQFDGEVENLLANRTSLDVLQREWQTHSERALAARGGAPDVSSVSLLGTTAVFKPLPETLGQQLDDLCDQFEQAWRSEERPQLASFLQRWNHAEGRLELFENLLLIELHWRREKGEAPEASEYQQLFPDASEAIGSVFATGEEGCRLAEAHGVVGNRYTILRPHARGGLGQVFVARDEELGREVALKEMQPRFARDRQSRARFMVEAEVTGNLEHPGIVPVYGLGRDEQGCPFYAMRFVHGDSLQQAIDRFHQADAQQELDDHQRVLQLRQLLGRFLDVCHAVEYAHSRGVVHRDLKPANVMLGKYGETLVVDWGLAKVQGSAEARQDPRTFQPRGASGALPTQAGEVLGTPAYMSPEQASGELDSVGPASDIYSLGATLYNLLTGKVPFDGPRSLDVLDKVRRGDYPRPRLLNPRVPPPMEAICQKAMALQPSARYASPRELVEEIEHWLADESVDAYTERWSERLGRWTRRHRAWALAATSALLLISCVSILALISVNRARHDERLHREEATRRLSQTRSIIDDLLTDTALKLQSVPGGQRVEQSLLERAANEYEVLAGERSDDPRLQEETGLACLRSGRIQRLLGREQEAAVAIEKSVRIFTRLLSQREQDRQSVRHLANARFQLAALHCSAKRYSQALELLRTAINDLQAELNADPLAAACRFDLAECQQQLGLALEGLNRTQDSLQVLQAARQNYVRLLQDDSQDVRYQTRLAECWDALGLVQQQVGKSADAEQAYRKGIEHATLAAKLASGNEVNNTIIAIEEHLGGLLIQLGRLDEAQRMLEASIDTFETFARVYPDFPEYARRLCQFRTRLAALDRERGNHAQAGETLQTVIDDLVALTARFPQTPALRVTLTEAYQDQSLAHLDRGQLEAASESARRAVEQTRQLVAAFPNVPDHRSLLANAYNNQGRTYRRRGQLEKAEVAWKASAGQLRELVREFPDRVHYVDQCALALTNYGSLCFQLANQTHESVGVEQSQPLYRQAATVLEEAVHQYRQLIVDNPDRPIYREHLLMTYIHLAPTYAKLDRYGDAVTQLKEAAADGEQLITRFPDVPRFRQRVAEVYQNLAAIQSNGEEFDEGQRALQRAIELIVKLCREYPDDAGFRKLGNVITSNQAIGLTMRQRYAEAVHAWERVLFADEFPATSYARVLHASALAATRATEEALAIVDQLPDSPAPSGLTQWLAAGVYAVAYVEASRDVSLSPELKSQRLDAIAQSALLRLRGARDARWFDARQDLETVQDIFAPMLDRPGFRELLQQLRSDLGIEESRTPG